MKLYPVRDPQTRKEFFDLPKAIYKGDPNYIRPWDHEVMEVFDPEKNKFFRHGELDFWVLKDDAGITIGRVAAFIDRRSVKKFEQQTGGMGFFECINDQSAANMLFDQCKAWLQEREVEAMDGPVNFGEKDRNWGLLVDGFHPPIYHQPYHPPYYKDLFLAYGFQVYYEQYYYFREIFGYEFEPSYIEKANRILENPDYSIPEFHMRDLEKFADDFHYIYNEAWAKHEAFKPMDKRQALRVIKKLKPVLDPVAVIFMYCKGEPAGFFISIPDINQIIKHLNGKFGPWEKLKFLWHKWRKTSKTLVGIVYGVVPKHQGKGIEAAMAKFLENKLRAGNYGYENFELGWIGDWNPKMMVVADQINVRKYKTLWTMRKLFDETKEFHRRPIIGKVKK
jgi:hypothetical protein